MAETNPFGALPDVAAFLSALDSLVKQSVQRHMRDFAREELRS